VNFPLQHLTGYTRRYKVEVQEGWTQADGKKMCIDLDTMPGVHDRNQRKQRGVTNKKKQRKSKKPHQQ